MSEKYNKIYEDDDWTIEKCNGNLRISLFKDYHYVEELTLTPDIMRSKLLDTLKELPEEIWKIS